MSIIEALNWRYATKEFDPSKKISQSDLDTINEALRLTASSFGVQPWKFLIISDQKVKDSLLEHSWGQKQVVDCSHHIVMCTPTDYTNENVDSFIKSTAEARSQSTSDLDGYSNVVKNFLSYKTLEQKQQWMKDQVYIALGNLLTTCAILKIDACPMEGIIKEKYDEILGLKEKGLTTIVACPIGYRSDSDKYASAAKVRFPLDKIIEII